MKKLIKAFSLLIFLNLTSGSTLNLTCSISDTTINHQSFHSCIIENHNISSTKDLSISSIHGIKSKTDVQGLVIKNSLMKYFVEKFDEFLPSIKGLAVENCELVEINREDFGSFTGINYLRLADNDIEFLPKNLFSRIHDLWSLFIDEKKIHHVDPKLFLTRDDLDNIFYIDFNFGGCNESYQVRSANETDLIKVSNGISDFYDKLKNKKICFNFTANEILTEPDYKIDYSIFTSKIGEKKLNPLVYVLYAFIAIAIIGLVYLLVKIVRRHI